VPEWTRRYLQPREGWLSTLLLLVMALTVVWSVQRAGWLPHAEFLTPIAFYAVVAGALLGISRLSVVAVLPISASFGSLLVLWIVGGEYFPRLAAGARLVGLRSDAIDWIRILFAQGYAPQLTPYAVGMGLVLWMTAFMAAYTLYRHHRVLDSILLLGAALIVNLSASLANLLGYLVLFMVSALLLWLRAALNGRKEAWQRRRVNENEEVPGAMWRSGIVFIVGSVIMAWVLTSVAVAAPLTSVWNNLDTVWDGVSGQLDAVFGGLNSGESRFTGTNFGSKFSISGNWSNSDQPVLSVAVDRATYLRAATYDIYTGRGWDQSAGQEREVPPEQLLFPKGAPEAPTLNAFDIQTIEVAIEQPSSRTLFTAGYPIKAYVPVRIVETGNEQFLGAMKATTSIPKGSSYSLTVALSEATVSQLEQAGTDYPEAVTRLYLGTSGLTDRTRDLARRVTRGAANPYDRAVLLAKFLQGKDFTYRTNVQLPTDPNQDAVDFFLFDPEHGRIGFCEHYATAMVELARSLDIPARMAVGFAPGQRIQAPPGAIDTSITWQVRLKNAHAWAELYFPGYGWQIFEATKTINPVVRLVGGGVQGSGGGGEQGNRTPPPFDFDPGSGKIQGLESSNPLPNAVDPLNNGGTGDDAPSATGGNVLVLVALILGLLGYAVWRWRSNRRQLRFLAPGDRQWRRLTLAADRAGVAQRPAETIYEYAGWLEEQLPARSPEIRTIAEGKVWHSYSGRGISGTVIARMEDAWKRLQLPLLWLAVRRRLRALLPAR
jgi:transglutaminase-like putative cysteine protease